MERAVLRRAASSFGRRLNLSPCDARPCAPLANPERHRATLETPRQEVDVILWVGISFEQSASTAYFRRVRHMLQEAGRLERVVQVCVLS